MVCSSLHCSHCQGWGTYHYSFLTSREREERGRTRQKLALNPYLCDVCRHNRRSHEMSDIPNKCKRCARWSGSADKIRHYHAENIDVIMQKEREIFKQIYQMYLNWQENNTPVKNNKVLYLIDQIKYRRYGKKVRDQFWEMTHNDNPHLWSGVRYRPRPHIFMHIDWELLKRTFRM
jgi:hypothetical protein